MDRGVQPNVQYRHRSKTTAGAVFDFFSALGTVAFAYSGHNVVMEIQASLPSSPERPSKKLMWKGAIFTYIIVALCYFPVALIGYWTFGDAVEDNILITLQRPKWLVAMANMFVAVHLIGGYQVRALKESSLNI